MLHRARVSTSTYYNCLGKSNFKCLNLNCFPYLHIIDWFNKICFWQIPDCAQNNWLAFHALSIWFAESRHHINWMSNPSYITCYIMCMCNLCAMNNILPKENCNLKMYNIHALFKQNCGWIVVHTFYFGASAREP